MLFQPKLEKARLIQRYKRFLADIELPDGSVKTIHCANTGAMTGCAEPGSTVWYSTSNNKKRKYPNSWELTETAQGYTICVNTIRANQLAVEAINSGVITELAGYSNLATEVKYGQENSKIDVFLSGSNKSNCYVEVKSVTLLGNTAANLDSKTTRGQGYFPDAVTTRGQKHLRELTEMVISGHRAVLLFTVLHSGIENVSIAHHIDAEYLQLLQKAQQEGVEVLCYKAELSEREVALTKPIEFLCNEL